ncbi:MAG: hypothetical protein QM690_00505 [Sphingobium sp.]
MRGYGLAALAMLLSAVAGPAFAQAVQGPDLSIEATNDYRERGLSWSRGAPTLAVSGALPVTDGISLHAGAMGLRGSARAAGGDVGASLGARYSGGEVVRLSGGVTVRLFPGRSALHYWELDARADYDLGPATVGAGISYAPSQDAIGGDNLYLDAGATIAMPGTPLAFVAGIGHSSGGTDDPARSARLRPEGSYADWRIGVDYRTGPYAIGLRYSDTSIDERRVPFGLSDRHAGSRLSAFLRWDIF